MYLNQSRLSLLWTLFFSLVTSCNILSRSIHRPFHDHKLYQIYDEHNPKKIHYFHYLHLQEWTLFRFDELAYLNKAHFTFGNIKTRKNTIVNTDSMQEDLEELATKINHKALDLRNLAHFTILKKDDFSIKSGTGSLILKHKELPFVIKIFAENPLSFCHPFSKGIIPSLFFYMSNGSNRYLTGLSRIPNRDAIEGLLKNTPLENKVVLPRKWYWEPKNSHHFIIESPNKTQIRYPYLYAIICDAISIDKTFSFFSQEDLTHVQELTALLGNRIDPNSINFAYEKKTHHIALIDTEHFAHMLGLKKHVDFKTYLQWYSTLAQKFLSDCLFTHKKNIDPREPITKNLESKASH